MSTSLIRSCTPPSRVELTRRWDAVRALMRERETDALVVQNSNDWLGGYYRWFTGSPATNAYPRTLVFPAEGGMSTVGQGPFDGVVTLDGNDPGAPGVVRQISVPSYVSVGYTGEYDANLILDELRRGAYRSVGLVAPAAMYHRFGARLEAELAGAGVRTLDFTDCVDRIKNIKSPEEQALIRRAAAMQDEVLRKIAAFVRPGLHDFEVAAYARYVGQQLGSDQGIFIGSSAPAGEPAMFRPPTQQGRALCKGDTLNLLIENNGPGGYYTELLRPIVLGRASTEQCDLWAFLLEAQQVTLALLKPGALCRDIFAAYNDFLHAHGRPPERRLHCHGQGYDMVERPLIRDDEPGRIEAGMNMVLHPAVKTDSSFMTVVDNYLIGDAGPSECLHRTPKTIIELA